MTEAPAPSYRPPTVDEVERLLSSRRPTPGVAPWARWVVIAGVGVVVLSLLLSMIDAGEAAALLPVAAVLIAAIGLRLRANRERAAHDAVNAAHELSALRRSREALAEAWRLWPSGAASPSRRRQLLAIMAQSLEEIGAWEQALRVLDELLETLPAPSPPELMLRLRRASVLVWTEQLTDVDDELRSARPRLGAERANLGWALYRQAELLRDAATGHADRVEALGAPLIEELRPLGVDAAVGYAAAAVCLARLADADQKRQDAPAPARPSAMLDPDRPAAERLWAMARDWWRRACDLAPEAPLVARVPQGDRWLPGLASREAAA
ncbi:MAG: hypothetical protein AAGA57_03230 [Planctomycetota bacterium]